MGGPAQPVEDGDGRPIAQDPSGLVDPTDVATHIPRAAGLAPDVDRPAERRFHRRRQRVDRRLHPGPGLEDLARDGIFGCVDRGRDGGGQIAGIDEVPGLLAIAVDHDRLAADGVAEPRRDDALLVERVRPVGVREPERAGGEAVRGRVRLAVRLARQLRGPVRRNGVGKVGLVGRWFVVARGRVRRGEHESSRAGEPGRVKKPEGLVDVDREGPERIGYRIRDAGARREVDDGVDTGHGRPNRVGVGQGRPDHLSWDLSCVQQVADREIVEDSDAIPAPDEVPGEV